MKRYFILSIFCFMEIGVIFATGTANKVKRPGESLVALIVVVAIFVLLFVVPKLFKKFWLDKKNK